MSASACNANAYLYDDLVDAECALQQYEFNNKLKYVIQRQDKDFCKYDFEQLPEFIKKHRIQWNDTQKTNGPVIISDGTPFLHLGSRSYVCHQGPKQQKKKDNCNDDHDYNKRKKTSQPSKKVSCPSEIRMRCILRVEKFQTNVDAPKHVREKVSRAVRHAINEKSLTSDDVALWVLIKFPEENDHIGHFTNEMALYTLPLHKDVSSKVKRLVQNGIQNVNVIKKILETFVKEELGMCVPKSDRRFYPSDKTIRSLKKYTLDNLRDNDKDEAALDHQISTWREDGTLGEGYIRLRTKEHGKFLFLYQTAFQKRLLIKYGNSMVLLDATYRYCLYDVPLYQLCVPTNVGYFVVATFITEFETAECVTEALTLLKEAAPLWKPDAFMVDDDEREIIAIQSVFPEADVFLCEFHRMQAWVRWLNSHKISSDVLPLMKAIAAANSHDACDEAIRLLEASTFWKASSELRTWFPRHWLKYRERWVVAYRTSHIHLTSNTTNGLERQHEELKRYLSHHGDRTLVGTVTCIVCQFSPESQIRYEEANVRACSLFKPYSTDIPAFLANRPPKFVDHCALRIPPQVLAIPADQITAVSDGTFAVKSVETPGAVYAINLGSEEILPSCTCLDFEKHGWICKHFLAVFEHSPNISWESLPVSYKHSPVFNLDMDVLGQDVAKQDAHLNTSISQQNLKSTQDPEQQQTRDIKKPTAKQDHKLIARLGARGRSVLHYLKNATYLLEENKNTAALTKLLQSLNKLKKSVSGDESRLKPVFKRRKIHKVAKMLLKKYKSRRQRKPMGLRKKHTTSRGTPSLQKKLRVPKPTRKDKLSVPTVASASAPAYTARSESPPSSGPHEAANSRLRHSDQTELSGPQAVCRRGLLNKSQNCWLNATLQALQTVLSGQSILTHLEETSVGTDREVAARVRLLARLMASLSTLQTNSAVDPTAVLREVYTWPSYMPGPMGQQEDAQEFLLQFLGDMLTCGRFEGLTTSWAKRCFSCDHTTSNGETIESCLSLDVAVDYEGRTRELTSVQECLEFHFEIWETLLDVDAPECANCSSRTGGSARLPRLNNSPDVVVCHLKRFKFENNTLKKLFNMIDVLSSRTIELNGATYDLCAVVCHNGRSIQEGHYVAAVKPDDIGLFCNDRSVELVNFDDFLSDCDTQSHAYLLFYKKRVPPVDAPGGMNLPEMAPPYDLREPVPTKRSSWTPAGCATAGLQRTAKSKREIELEKIVTESMLQKQKELDELLATLQSAPVKSHLQKIIRGESSTRRSKLFTRPLARTSENRILALGSPLGPFDDVSEIVHFCDTIYSEILPTDQRLSSDRIKYILYVLVPEAIIRAIQIMKSCGGNEAEDLFKNSSATSKEEIELEQLTLDRQVLTKSEERSVNRRAMRAAAKTGIKLQFNKKDLYSSSDDEY